MVEILLRSYPCEKPSIHKSSCARTGVVGKEGGEEGATGHQGGTLALQFNLTEQARDLHTVHLGGRDRRKEGEREGGERGREGGEGGRKGGREG